MAKLAPQPLDLLDFQFKLRCRLKVFNNDDSGQFNKPCNLITAASNFGLVFVGSATPSLQVIQTKSIEECKGNENDYSCRTIPLPSQPKFLSVNCDHTKLCVVVEKDSCANALIYDVVSFVKEGTVLDHVIRLSPNPNVNVLDISWNPTISNILTVCKSDGSLGAYSLKESGIEINELPIAACATCMCWSPKGKQIAVGSRDGKITQYKPDLKAVKAINAPPLEGVQKIIALQWISNYQFIGVYHDESNNVSNILVVDAPKTGEPAFTNYEDICYSNGMTRPIQFFIIFQPTWNVLLVASSNSMEVGVMGIVNDQWIQWILIDAARAELPLLEKRKETFPIGLALDTAASQPLQWAETTLPPAPLLYMLSDHGVLCCFDVVNTRNGAVSICSPPKPLSDTNGLKYFSKNALPTSDPVVSTTMNTPTTVNTPDIVPNPELTITLVTTEPAVVPKPKIEYVVPPQNTLPTTTKPLNFMSLETSSANRKILSAKSPQKVTVAVTPPIQTQPSKLQSSSSTTVLIPKEASPSMVGQLVSSQPVVEKQIKGEEHEAALLQQIRKDCILLESELHAVLHKARSLKFDLGADTEIVQMLTDTETLESFLREVSETCTGQSAEIYALKQSVINTWAWYEEARSRFTASQDPQLAVLLKAQPLDPASERQLSDIRHLLYYIESQLMQASRALDEEWDNFQNYCRKTYKIQIPSIEVIYQSMVRQSAIIQKQIYVLKDISNRIKRCSRNSRIPLLMSSENVSCLEKELINLHIQRQDFSEVLYESVLNKEKQMTTKKVDKLRGILLSRKVSHVSVNKPHLSSVKLQKKEVEDTILGAQVSPVPKDKGNVVRSLNFIQSTPKTQTSITELAPKEVTINKNQFFNKLSDSSAFASTAVASTTSDILLPKATTSFSFVSPIGAISKPSGLFQAVTSSIPTTTKSFVFTTQSNPVKPASSVGLFSNISVASNNTKLPNTESKTTFQTISAIGTQPNTKALTFISPPQTSLFNVPNKKPEENTTTALVTPKTVFGTTSTSIVVPSVTSAPLFGTLSKVSSTTTKSGFTATTTKPISTQNLFIATPITSTKENVTSPTYSLFGTSALGNTTALFGIKTSSAPSNTTDNAAMVSKNVTAASVPSTSTNTSASAALITSVFNPTTAATTTSTSIFGSKTATTVTSTSLIGGSVPTTSVQGSIFSAPTTGAVTASIFGIKTTQSIFSVPVSSKPEFSGTSPVTSTTAVVVTSSSTSSVDTTTTISTTPSSLTTTTAAIFATTKSTGIFSVTCTSPVATTTSVFVPAKSTSIFGAPVPSTVSIFSLSSPATVTTTSVTSPTIKTTPSIFGTSVPTNVTTAPSSAAQTSATTQASIFGANTAPIFSTSSTSPLFGTTSTTNSIFGSTPSTSTTGSIFGDVTSTSSGSIFASAATGQKFIFGGGATTTTTTTTTPAATVQPLNLATTKEAPFAPAAFGSTTVAAPIFGSTTTTSAFTNSNTFGTPTTKETPLFGQPAVFGSNFSTPTTTVTPVFGSPTSVFGTATTTSPFGTATTTSPFGMATFGSTQSSNSVFGQPAAFGSSVFAKTTASSIFGASPSTTTSAFSSGNSAFGGVSSFSPFNTSSTSSSVFGSPSAQPSAFSFAGSAPSANTFGGFPSSTSSFGFGNTTAPKEQSAFGFGGLNVATSSSSGFGQTQPQNPFGRTSGTEQKSVFGGGSIFSTPASTSSSIFGLNSSSTFGSTSQQTFGSSAFSSQQSVFGQKPVFGQGSFSSGGSIFGGGGAVAAQPGPFSGGGQTVGQSGFGAAAAFQKPGGFGGSPVFGSTSPVSGFGSPPSFGGAPTFGNSPTFGTSKVFGSSSPQNTFGSAPTQQNTFGSLANQNTVGFGSLAQQTQTPTTQATPFGGGSSFSSWR